MIPPLGYLLPFHPHDLAPAAVLEGPPEEGVRAYLLGLADRAARGDVQAAAHLDRIGATHALIASLRGASDVA